MQSSSKRTFIDVRSQLGFDVEELAVRAEVSSLVVTHMLIGVPVRRRQAEKVLGALSQMTGGDYSLSTVGVICADVL